MLKYVTNFKSFNNCLFWFKELLKNFRQFWEFEIFNNQSFWKPSKVLNLRKKQNSVELKKS
jgi:hypothetical protein